MPNLRVVALAPFAAPIRERLSIPADVVPIAGESSPEMAAAIRDADVLVNGAFLTEWAGHAPRLRLLQGLGAGYEGLVLDAVPAGCFVANVYGHDYGITEYVFMTMAALNRELFQADADLRRGVWRGGPLRELRGRSVLVVGLGQIGREVARWGNFVGMRVSAVTEHPTEARREASGLVALGAISDLATFAADADFVVIAVPHSAATTGLVDERILAAMRPSAYLINVGRGPVVDQWALHRALRDGRLAGAAIDVWYHYPEGSEPTLPADAPFHELSNVILTPHTAGYTEGTMRHRFDAIAENIRRVAAGERPMNVVWPRA
ncbi:MAG TPA: 2-hydroxyacid dehydrogenase [Candidatus Saccharimonadales bacterium]|nr:2-hydroxyacid dehydrogenase [Candidatus Saccharimonadales bacterium]